MSSLKNNIQFTHATSSIDSRDTLHINGFHTSFSRSRTPNGLFTPTNLTRQSTTTDNELGAEEDPRVSIFKDIYARNEARINALFAEDGTIRRKEYVRANLHKDQGVGEIEEELPPQIVLPPKKVARTIDEDDYDESNSEDDAAAVNNVTAKSKNSAVPMVSGLSSTSLSRGTPTSSSPASVKGASTSRPVKSSEDVRKKLEEDKKATEDAAKRSFHTLFYTLENDRDAMLDQKKLEESDRQVDVEMNGTGASASNVTSSGHAQHGTLSQTNLGASSLTLKHLIARIDAKRDQVRASDAELRTLMSEVRKNRSKWASPEKIGQEELYEAAEKVLCELKAMTEHSTAFLTRVNKREAPDYYNGKSS